MAGLDPAIEAPKTRVWVLCSSPGMMCDGSLSIADTGAEELEKGSHG
jgi:hypothetical protein